MIEHLLLPLVSERFKTDSRYREGHVRIINALKGRQILGVHVPQMKSLAKELSKSEEALEILSGFEKEFLSDRFSLSYEETVVWGLMINYLKVPMDVRLNLLTRFIPVIDNWGVCDTFCSNAKWVKDSDDFWAYLQPFWRSDREFEVRFAVVMSMILYLNEKDFTKVCNKLESLDFQKIKSEYISLKESRGVSLPVGSGIALGQPPYYVRMAVAWLLATALSKIPDTTREYVNSSTLPQDVIRLYVRKARESFKTRDVIPF